MNINTFKAAVFIMKGDVTGAGRLIERAFGIGPAALTEAVQILIAFLEPNAD